MAPVFRIIEKDNGWELLARALKGLAQGQTYAKAGIFGRKAEADHRASEGEASVAKIAAVHEFGCTINHPNGGKIVIPERSFIRSTWDAKREKYFSDLRGVVWALVQRRLPVAKLPAAMAALGMQIVADMQATIRAGIAPPLAASTLAQRTKPRKGSRAEKAGKGDVPLIDSAQLINALTHAVKVAGKSR